MAEVISHFENIRESILTELKKAKKSIFVTSAYFTDYELANELSTKSKNGVYVELIISNSDINEGSEPIFLELRNSGVNLFKNGAKDFTQGGIMHNKFCVIDYETIITGSYNWTRQAERNKENIVIFKNELQANIFLQNFYNLRRKGWLFSILSEEININLSTEKHIVNPGEYVTISYEVTNANEIYIDSNQIEKIKDEIKIQVLANTIIEIKAKNTETNKVLIKTILIRVAVIPTIEFSISTNFIIRTQTAELKWKVVDAESVNIEPNIGRVENEGTRIINSAESTTYKLTAIGLTKETNNEQLIHINVFPTPILERLSVPTPTNIKIEAEFIVSKIEVPSSLNLGSITKFTFNTPKIKSLDSKLIKTQPTIDDLSKILNVSRSELFDTVEDSDRPIKSKLFRQLERIFNKNHKMIDVIKTIRKNYE